MKLLRQYLFVFSAGLFMLHQLLQYGFGISIPFVDDYLDPFLGTIAALYLLTAERKFLFGVSQLDGPSVVVATCGFVFISEWVFPWLSDSFYFDWGDVVAIVAGALIFWFWPATRTPTPE